MKSEKQQVLELIDMMPDEVSAETIISELQFRILMLRRGEEARRGENLIPHEDVKAMLSKWLDSSGT